MVVLVCLGLQRSNFCSRDALKKQSLKYTRDRYKLDRPPPPPPPPSPNYRGTKCRSDFFYTVINCSGFKSFDMKVRGCTCWHVLRVYFCWCLFVFQCVCLCAGERGQISLSPHSKVNRRNERFDWKRLSFKTKFNEPPYILFGMTLLHADNSRNIRADTCIDGVRKDSFTLIAFSWGDSITTRVDPAYMACGFVTSGS